MDLSRPETLSDLIADGAIEQAAVDAALGSVTGVEFDGLDPEGTDPDAACWIRLHPGQRDLPATRVARVEHGTWRWLTSRTAGFDVPELHSDQVASDDLMRAVRTLFGNAPALLAPHSDDVVSVVVPHGRPATLPVPQALAAGLPLVPPGKAVRALEEFAAARGLGERQTADRVEFSDGTAVVVDAGEGIDVCDGASAAVADVVADAVLVSAEHQLLFDGRFPDAHLTLDASAGRARVVSRDRTLDAAAHVVGLIRNDEWVWAWADPRFNTTPAAHAVRAVHRFGTDHRIPVLTRPVTACRNWLIDVCKPITHRWVHGFVHLNDAVAVVLLEHPELTLPAPSEAAILATFQTPFGPGVDGYRAVGSYANFRGLGIRGETLTAPDTGTVFDLSVADGRATAVPRGTPRPGGDR